MGLRDLAKKPAPSTGDRFMTETRKHQIPKTLGLSIILTAHVFLFVPFTLYVGNLDEFVTPFWSILALYSIPALGISVC